MKTKNASFQIADLGENIYIAKRLVKLQKEHPECFVEEAKIDYVFGSFRCALWQGERAYMGYMPIDEIEEIIKEFNKNKVGIYYTFNNRKLDKNDVYDNYCNLIMKMSDNNLNVVEVYDENLEKYLRKNYKKIKYSKRITESNFDEINEDKYDFYILDTIFNDDYEKLETIKHPEKVIIVLNDYFVKGDKNYDILMDKVGEAVKNRKEASGFKIDMYGNYQETFDAGNIVQQYQVARLYKLGINHYRIEGRNSTVQYFYIPSIMYYLVEEEHQGVVFKEIQEAFFDPIAKKM